MKTSVLVLYFMVLGSVVGFIACHGTYGESGQPATVHTRSNPLLGVVDSTGIYHNILLDSIFTFYKEHSQVDQTVFKTLEIIYDYLDNETPWQSVEVEELIIDSIEVWYADWEYEVVGSLDRPLNFALDLYNQIDESRFLSSEELTIINNILYLFMNTPATPSAWQNGMLDIRDDYDEVEWDLGEGELAGGILSIGLSSFAFWTDPEAPVVGDVLPFIQLDAVGYLLAWGYSFYSDCVSDPPDVCGTCACPGGRDRIVAGLAGAAGASAGARKW